MCFDFKIKAQYDEVGNLVLPKFHTDIKMVEVVVLRKLPLPRTSIL